MALQINQYAVTEVGPIAADSLFDIDAEVSVGVYESRKLPFSTLQSDILAGISATNGLNNTAGAIKLGGVLTETTIVNGQTNDNLLQFKGGDAAAVAGKANSTLSFNNGAGSVSLFQRLSTDPANDFIEQLSDIANGIARFRYNSIVSNDNNNIKYGSTGVILSTDDEAGGNLMSYTQFNGVGTFAGSLVYQDGSQGTAGHVLTSTGTLGEIAWSAPGGDGNGIYSGNGSLLAATTITNAGFDLIINGAGKTGIGTTVPDKELTVGTNGSDTGINLKFGAVQIARLIQHGAGNDAALILGSPTEINISTLQTSYIANGENFGINTSTPDNNFDVQADANGEGINLSNGTTFIARLIQNAGANHSSFTMGTLNEIILGSGQESYINNGFDFGIGLSTGISAKLHVNGTTLLAGATTVNRSFSVSGGAIEATATALTGSVGFTSAGKFTSIITTSGFSSNNVGIEATAVGGTSETFGGKFQINTGAINTPTFGTYGVFSKNQASTNTPNFAGYFESDNSNGSSNYGIKGFATGASSKNIGAWFRATGATTNYALVTNGGNVGFGTITPSAQLDVVGSTELNGAVTLNTAGANTIGDVWTATGTTGEGDWAAASGADGNGIYDGSGSLSGATVVTMGSNDLTLSGAGKTIFNRSFDVTGGALEVTATAITGSTGFTTAGKFSSIITTSGFSANNVGINVDAVGGTSETYAGKFNVNSGAINTPTFGTYGIFSRNQASTNTANYAGWFQSNGTGTTKYGAWFQATGAGTNNYAIKATATGATNNYAIVTNGGNVGFGTLTPSEQLHVNGVVRADTHFKVSTIKVVGSQGAGVADATDAATAITQLNALISRMEAHGLIATV